MSIEKLCRTLRKLSGKLISQLTSDEKCKALIEQRGQRQGQQGEQGERTEAYVGCAARASA